MQVCIVTEEINPTWGGAQRYANELILALVDKGIDVTVVTSREHISPTPKGAIKVHRFAKPILPLPAVSYPSLVMNSLLRQKQILRMKKESTSCIYHDVDMGYAPGADVATAQQPAGALAASIKAGKPFWADDWKHLIVVLMARQPFFYPLFSKKWPNSYKHIISPSNFVADSIHRTYEVPLSKISIIPHGVNTERFMPRNEIKEEVRRNIGISKDMILACFSGIDMTRKGLFVLLKALEHLKNIHLLVLGRNELPRYYREMCAKLGMLNRVTTLLTDKPELYYAASDMMVFPSLFDAFGMVVLEGMACGLPVITTPTAGASEIIDNGIDGIVVRNPLNHLELAQEMKELASSDNLRRSIGMRARTKSLSYSWHNIAQKVVQVYESL